MNLVSLLILPAVISLRNDTGARFAIAGAALVVLLGAIAVLEAVGRDVGNLVGAGGVSLGLMSCGDACGIRGTVGSTRG